MNNLNKGTGNFIDPLSPIYDLSYDPKGGSGILQVKIFGSFFGEESLEEKYLPYQWSDTVNGIEVEIEKPYFFLFEPNALEEDIYNAMKEQLKFDHITYITK